MSDTAPSIETPGRARALLRVFGYVVAAAALAAVGVLACWLIIDDRGRRGLWHVVDGLCVPSQRWFATPFPCLEVSPTGGYAVLHAPFDGTQILVVPITPILGAEDPAMRRPDAPDLWTVAWRERRRVGERLGRPLRDDETVLAINSESARTQNQYHIHVDCIAPVLRRFVEEKGPALDERWQEMTPVPSGIPYRLRRIDLATLARERPEVLIDRELSPTPGDLENLSFAVIGTGRGPAKNPELVLAVTYGFGDAEGGHAEELMDHACPAE